MPVAAAARRLGVSPSLVHVWVRQGVLAYDQRRSASRVWVRLDGGDLARLDGSSPLAPRLPRLGEVMRAGRLSRDEMWERVRRGAYRAFRVRRGRGGEWPVQRPPGAGVGWGGGGTNQH